ncbi:hypothetical protein HAX54_028396 [Datura stramonium]|uniref:Uncharacterized protein n=1 Tax=Datura stramonium TaxID=4076 RepID=A0ABS8S9I8_DATST|nr:hypothetical protein [Datura stramonium]
MKIEPSELMEKLVDEEQGTYILEVVDPEGRNLPHLKKIPNKMPKDEENSMDLTKENLDQGRTSPWRSQSGAQSEATSHNGARPASCGCQTEIFSKSQPF